MKHTSNLGKALKDAVILWAWAARLSQGPDKVTRDLGTLEDEVYSIKRFKYNITKVYEGARYEEEAPRFMCMKEYGRIVSLFETPSYHINAHTLAWFFPKAPQAGHLVWRYQPEHPYNKI